MIVVGYMAARANRAPLARSPPHSPTLLNFQPT
jgi:hypothetical protein